MYSVFDLTGKNVGGYAEYDTRDEAEKEMLFLQYDCHIDCYVAESVREKLERRKKLRQDRDSR